MATAVHGKDGVVKVGGTVVAFVDGWDGNIDPSYDDITSEDSAGWQDLLPGIKKASGSIKVRYAMDDTNGQSVLQSAVMNQTAVALSLYPSGTAHYFGGTAYLKLAVSSPHGAPVEGTFSFESKGAWTYT